MTSEHARALINQWIDPMIDTLDLEHFHITVKMAEKPSNDTLTGNMCPKAEIEISNDYEDAQITLYPDAIDSGEEYLYDTLRHEFFHILIHPFVIMEEAALAGARSRAEERILKVIHNFAAERIVANLERTNLIPYVPCTPVVPF